MKEVINDVTARPDGFRRTEHLFGESLSPSLSPAGADVEHSKHSVASETIPLQRIGFAGDTRRPRRRRRRRRRWGETHTRHADFVECGAGAREQKNRWRVIAWSAVGLACLLMSHWLRPENGSLFEFPADPAGGLSLAFGVIGTWLVPGLWLSALVMRTGAGLPAWAGTRIGATLVWYAAVGPVIHHLGQGARVTATGVLLATVLATAAAMVGVLLGQLRRPTSLWRSALISMAVGAVCAQLSLTVAMKVWSLDMNYEHLRRLDWLIVLCSSLLVTLGSLSRPMLPPSRTIRNGAPLMGGLGVAVVTVVTLAIVNVNWSPAQRMPSAFGLEQVVAPGGFDVAVSLTGIGPGGPELIRAAQFSAQDESGRPVPVRTQLSSTAESADATLLLVELPDSARSTVCRSGRPTKLTLKDAVTGARVQALVPERWCTT